MDNFPLIFLFSSARRLAERRLFLLLLKRGILCSFHHFYLCYVSIFGVFSQLRRFFADSLSRKQADIFSAAIILAVATFASAVLGLVRDRTLACLFSSSEIGVYFAAFRLPDTLFEILILGSLSAAFIPTFVDYISRRKEKEAWEVTSATMTLTLLFFLSLAVLISVFSYPLSRLLAPGFDPGETALMAKMTRILLITQGFFVPSLILTGVLKSFQRFLIPAIAPLFYNIGIVAGALLLGARWGILAPTWGAVIGAAIYFAAHLPLACRLGFRLRPSFRFSQPGVRRIIALAVPRTLEIASAQVLKASDLFFSSLISVASYGYLTFASHLASIPVSLVGSSLADAALPALSYERQKIAHFRETLLTVFRQIIFLAAPLAVTLIVLRVPAVRLAFGAARFTWESTVLTGYALSAFALGVLVQSVTALSVRAFYALGDTLTPVRVGIASVLANIFLSALFVLAMGTPVWGVAMAFTLSNILQTVTLILLLCTRVEIRIWEFIRPALRVAFSSAVSGGVMYVLLKVLDRSAWDKRLSFLGHFSLPERFVYLVLDTRYTVNLIILTIAVAAAGAAVYLSAAKLLKVRETALLGDLWRRFLGLIRGGRPGRPLPPQASGGEESLT